MKSPWEEPSPSVHRFPMLDRVGPATPQSKANRLVAVYTGIVEGLAASAGPLLEVIAHRRGPILVHCAGGKDRTGVVVGVLLLAAGVSEDAVRADYRRTGDVLPAVFRRQRWFTGVDPRTRYHPDVLGTPDEAIEVVFDLIGRDAETARSWLVRHGAIGEDVDLWCRRIRDVSAHYSV